MRTEGLATDENGFESELDDMLRTCPGAECCDTNYVDDERADNTMQTLAKRVRGEVCAIMGSQHSNCL